MTQGEMFNTKIIDGVNVLKIKGAFTKETIPEMQKICYAAGKSKGAKGVLLDFEEITEIDTAAFACMIKFIKDHMLQGVEIGVINIKDNEQMLLDILKIDKAIRRFKDEEEAISELST